MTKEEFLKGCIDYCAQWMAYRDAEDLAHLFSRFFESNVCTPKGANRHLDADVIHAYAEGINNIEVLRAEGWVEFKQSGMCLCIGDEYRIKPNECKC